MFTEARRGRIFGSSNPYVMTAVVLGIEVAVADRSQGDLGQPALQVFTLMAELVHGVDADTADGADRERHTEFAQPARRPVEARAISPM